VIQIFDWLRENVNTFPGVFFLPCRIYFERIKFTNVDAHINTRMTYDILLCSSFMDISKGQPKKKEMRIDIALE